VKNLFFARNQMYLYLSFLFMMMLSFQNCSYVPMSFNDFHSLEESNAKLSSTGGAGGNGGGVEGKLYASYQRQVPHKYCHSNSHDISTINIYQDGQVEIQNEDPVTCLRVSSLIEMKNLDKSALQDRVLGYRDGLYVKVNQEQSDLSRVELWCREEPSSTEVPMLVNPLKYSEVLVRRKDLLGLEFEMIWYGKDVSFVEKSLLNKKSQHFIYQSKYAGVEVDASRYLSSTKNSVWGKVILNQNGQEFPFSCKQGWSFDGLIWPSKLALIEKIIQFQVFNNGNSALILSNGERNDSSASSLNIFNFNLNKLNNIFKTSQEGTSITNFNLSPKEDDLIFRSDFQQKNNFELYQMKIQSPYNINHIGRSLSGISNLNLQVLSDFKYSSDGESIFYKDNSHWIDELNTKNNNEYQWGEKNQPWLNMYSKSLETQIPLHSFLNDSYVGTSIYDYQMIPNLSGKIIARFGSSKWDLNIFGGNRFVVIDTLNRSSSFLQINFPILPGERHSKKWIGPWQNQWGGELADTHGDAFIIDPEGRGFVYPVRSFSDDIEWQYYDLNLNLQKDLPKGFRPTKFLKHDILVGQMGFNRFNSPDSIKFNNSTYNLQNDHILQYDKVDVVSLNSSNENVLIIKNGKNRNLYIWDNRIQQFHSILNSLDNLLGISSNSSISNLVFIVHDALKAKNKVCHFYFSNNQFQCFILEVNDVSEIKEFTISSTDRYLYYIADLDLDQNMEMYVYDLKEKRNMILSNKLYLFGGVVGYYELRTNDGMKFYFRTEDPLSKINYLFEWNFNQDF
jgi:hypothetical protein